MLSCDVLSKQSGRPRRLELNAAAKVNLALEVLGRRDDGYHEIATVMQTVDLSDRLVLEDADVVELRTTAPDVPTDGTNLALRAALALRDVAGSSRGVRITLEKRIPVAAGLGGGSSDAAAVLRALRGRRPVAELYRIARELGSDVPFFLSGLETAIGTGRGDGLEQCARVFGQGLRAHPWRHGARSAFASREPRAFRRDRAPPECNRGRLSGK